MVRLNYNKKGQVQNYAVPVFFLFLFGISSLFTMVVLTQLIDGYEDALTNNGANPEEWTSTMQSVSDGFIRSVQTYDYTIVIVLVALIIGIGLTSFKLRTNPAFFILTFITSLFFGFFSYVFNYVFKEFVSQTVFDSVRIFFPRTILLCTNLHWVALVALVVGSITLYAKGQDQSGGSDLL